MEQQQFLEEHVFKGLKSAIAPKTEPQVHQFNQEDFKVLLERCEYYGIGIYTIEAFLDGETYGASRHEDFRKKATDSAWYEKAFSTFSHTQEGFMYAATYKVSLKLLARY
ncbi:MAG: hypothetical protein P8M61_10390 [Crocinitomicaceae bacterium]|jgi:hypothetical protein|nr:hypothetical protein [Crocinitomicaceae bacterium]MDG1346327.1 hypothetical protein [Crocinitomicaceae bacterium]MDG2465485.1 hypothetical protein [Crocinitomicaceae bacterium]